MPLKNYFKGHGEKVMKSMKKTYKSDAKAEEVFYATANKKHETPKESLVKRSMKKAMSK